MAVYPFAHTRLLPRFIMARFRPISRTTIPCEAPARASAACWSSLALGPILGIPAFFLARFIKASVPMRPGTNTPHGCSLNQSDSSTSLPEDTASNANPSAACGTVCVAKADTAWPTAFKNGVSGCESLCRSHPPCKYQARKVSLPR